MKRTQFRAFLRRVLDRPVEPPSSLRVKARGGRRARVELGDFSGHTPYLPGDDLRFLDWKALARSGQKLLRTFDEVRHRRLVLIVDASASMSTRGERILLLLELWCFLALHRLDSLELVIAREDGVRAQLFEGVDALGAVRATIEQLEFRGSSGLSSLRDLGTLRSDESAVVLSDFWPIEETESVLERARFEGLRLLLVYARSAIEAQLDSEALPPHRGRVRIQDPESRDVLEVEFAADLHAAFLQEQHAWEARLTSLCAQYGHRLLVGDLPRSEQAALSLASWLPFLARRARRA